MKLLILFLALAVTVNAAPFHRKPVAKPVAPAVAPASLAAPETLPEPAKDTPPYTLNPDGSETISKQHAAEVKDWIIGIQRVNAEMANSATKAEGSEKEVRAFHAKALDLATDLQKAVNILTNDRNAQAAAKDKALTLADYWHQKDSEAVKKLWWWRLWAGGAILVGVLLIAGGLLMRFTSWGAKTLGPVVGKAALIAVAVTLLTSCAHRHPVTYRELSGQGIEPPGGYQDYLP